MSQEQKSTHLRDYCSTKLGRTTSLYHLVKQKSDTFYVVDYISMAEKRQLSDGVDVGDPHYSVTIAGVRRGRGST
jgi:hypothetical protein